MIQRNDIFQDFK